MTTAKHHIIHSLTTLLSNLHLYKLYRPRLGATSQHTVCCFWRYKSYADIRQGSLLRWCQIIGADSMGAMGAIAPTAKKLWGRCAQVSPQKFCCRFFFKQLHEFIFACIRLVQPYCRCTQPKCTVKITILWCRK